MKSVTNWRLFSTSHRILSKKGPTIDDILKNKSNEVKKKKFIKENKVPLTTRLAAVSVVSALVGAYWYYLHSKKEKGLV